LLTWGSKDKPSYGLDKLFLHTDPRLAFHKIILFYDVDENPSKKSGKDIRLTESRISFIHCGAPPPGPASGPAARLSNVPRSSIRFGTTLLGATPAKPSSTARMIGRPCVIKRVVLCGMRSSVSDERLMRVACNRALITNIKRKCG